MKRIKLKLCLSFIFGLIIQCGEIIARKDAVLQRLEHNIGSSMLFVNIICERTNQELFRSEHAEFPPSHNTDRLRRIISANRELFNLITVAYLDRAEPYWMRNLLENILRLNIVDKNIAFIRLHEQLTYFPTLFVKKLCEAQHAAIFDPANAGNIPTWDTTKLKAEIPNNIFNAVAVAYNANERPDWMTDILSYILPPNRLDQVRHTHPIVFRKNAVLFRLHQYRAMSCPSLVSILLEPENEEIFGQEYAAFLPTCNPAALRDDIDANRRLFRNIADAYNANERPDWMTDILKSILSLEKRKELHV